MNKEFIPYELALALKELGFDEPCFGYYKPNGELDYIENHILKDFPYLAKNSEWQDLVAAPLYQQAFKWIMQFPPLNKWACNIAVYSDGTYSIKDGKYAVHEYLSSEECLEKLIEIVEQKEK